MFIDRKMTKEVAANMYTNAILTYEEMEKGLWIPFDPELKKQLEQQARDLQAILDEWWFKEDETMVQEAQELDVYMKNLYPEWMPDEEAIPTLRGEIEKLIQQREKGIYNPILEAKITAVGIAHNKLVWVEWF